MAETALDTSKNSSIQQDELAELRAKKQRQLAASPPLLPAVLEAGPSLPEEQTQGSANPASFTSATEATLPPNSAEQSITAATKARRPRAASPRPDREGQVMISGYFPAETRRRLKIVAARQDRTLQQVMADAFEAWLRRHDKEA